MDRPTLLLGISATLLTVAACLAVRRLLDRRKEARLQQRLGGESAEAGLLSDVTVAPPPTSWMGRIDRTFERMVGRSGLKVTVGQALLLMLLAGVVLAGVFFFLRPRLWLVGFGLLLGTGLPVLGLVYLQSRWKIRLQEQLPGAYDLMARSLRAGLSLEQAVAMVGEQGAAPLAEEFRRASEQMKLGLAAPAALASAAQRIQLPDFDMVVSLVALHRTTGGNLALMLDRVAAGTRDRNQFRSYFRTATTLSRVTAVFIGGAIPALLIYYVLAQPEHIGNFLRSPLGLLMIGISLGLEIIGAVWLYLLLRVEY
jgi:tight adherence protein B